MKIGIVSLFPEMFQALTCGGITGRAVSRGLLEIGCWNPRDYTRDRRRSVDDRPYGGGPGMVMRYQPLTDAIRAAKEATGKGCKVIYMSPQGRRLEQTGVKELAERESMVLVAGRYEGVDERIIETEIDEEWSIGDYVLSGGELPAMVLVDAITRLLPDALGHDDSAREDSFFEGLLDCPHYTRPEAVAGLAVPQVLLEGNHEAIRRWRMQQALGRTWQRRRELLERLELSKEQRKLLDAYLREYEENLD